MVESGTGQVINLLFLAAFQSLGATDTPLPIDISHHLSALTAP